MSNHHLLNLAVLAEVTLTALGDLPAHAGDPQPAPVPAVPAAAHSAAKSPGARPLAAGEVWGQDYSQAWKKGKALNRPVLVHFHATWCGPCQQMEQTVLNTAGVLNEINAHCVAVKIDSDRQADLAQQFGIDALPCDVLIGTDGKILSVSRGALTADQYRTMISNLPRSKSAAPTQVKIAGN